MKMVVGIDTSCYTTSVALLDEEGALVADARKPLAVKAGGKGLAQSEMVFQHTRNLPELFTAAWAQIPGRPEIRAVAASTQPRPLPESYMPAFLVGAGYAKALAVTHQVPFSSLSHQEGHILAGLWSAKGPAAESFLAVHASGGTTEITRVEARAGRMAVEILGGTSDIAAGQLVDRVGVALALPFPAGPHLEQLAATAGEPAEIPPAVERTRISFAGPETHAKRLLARGESPAAVAAGVQACIAESVGRALQAAAELTGIRTVLLVGGVMANQHIRRAVTGKLCRDERVRLYFPLPEYSGDNAVGAAYFAWRVKHSDGQIRI
ncbi:MAG TPA: O-sialoglycoprotein endopeptidase [Selenomonadales bacterium]|nr:O-sialoglycoprotein endopeptidase [Selenomonadales bacterium]